MQVAKKSLHMVKSHWLRTRWWPTSQLRSTSLQSHRIRPHCWWYRPSDIDRGLRWCRVAACINLWRGSCRLATFWGVWCRERNSVEPSSCCNWWRLCFSAHLEKALVIAGRPALEMPSLRLLMEIAVLLLFKKTAMRALQEENQLLKVNKPKFSPLRVLALIRRPHDWSCRQSSSMRTTRR